VSISPPAQRPDRCTQAPGRGVADQHIPDGFTKTCVSLSQTPYCSAPWKVSTTASPDFHSPAPGEVAPLTGRPGSAGRSGRGLEDSASTQSARRSCASAARTPPRIARGHCGWRSSRYRSGCPGRTSNANTSRSPKPPGQRVPQRDGLILCKRQHARAGDMRVENDLPITLAHHDVGETAGPPCRAQVAWITLRLCRGRCLVSDGWCAAVTR
jgi:hypothetical protein